MEFNREGNKRYNDFSNYSRKKFGQRVQKLTLDAGFTCPNRDGSKGIGGCTYCNNDTFVPSYCEPTKSVSQQIKEGMIFFSKNQVEQTYHAYFQAYSNTYGALDHLKSLYEEALSHPEVTGLVISTRPDCVNGQILDYLEELARKYYIAVEFGIESTLDKTLEFINRGHTFEETQKALRQASGRNIHIGGHIILGLPGETRRDMLDHARKISELPIDTLKIHQLQIHKHTFMAKQYKDNPDLFPLFLSVEEYIDFVIDLLEVLNPKIVIERIISQSPPALLVAPKWNGLKNFEIIHKLEKKLEERNTWQGRLWEPALKES